MESKLPFKANLYFALIILAGIIVSVFLLKNLNFYSAPWLDLVFFSVITIILVFYPLILLNKATIYWLDDIPIFAALFLYGAPYAMLINGFNILIYEIYRLVKALIKRRGKIHYKWIIVNFSNPSRSMLALGISGLIYHIINQNNVVLTSFRNLIAILIFSFVKFLLDLTGVTFGVYLYSQNVSFKKIWEESYSKIIPNIYMVTPLSAILAFLYVKQTLLVIFLSIPIVALYISIESFRKTIKQTQETLNTLAKTIDQRDHSTYGHSERVAKISKAIAEEMKLDMAKISLIEKAGKIHDLGKIEIPDAILQKPDQLNEEELEIMKSHPKSILKLFHNLKIIKKHLPIEIAALHHEKYNGTGYNLGLKGNEIPIEARILAVADAFDAMINDRSYRYKFTEKEAVDKIIKNKGEQFDPEAVEAFLRIHKNGRIKQINDEWAEKEKIYLKKRTAMQIGEKLQDFSN